jgi:hypothetical protein
VNRLLLWLGPLAATLCGCVFYERPKRCQCGRKTHFMRRTPLGAEGCTTCIPETAQAGMRHDLF